MALVSSSWRLETLQYKRFNKASEFEARPPKLTLFQEYRGLRHWYRLSKSAKTDGIRLRGNQKIIKD